jgi:hypothetical protein
MVVLDTDFTMGRYLTKESIIAAINFWEFRIVACDELKDWRELIDFGWWVKSGLLSDEWMLDQVIAVLEKASNINPAYMVVEEISDYASLYPEKVIKIARLIVNNRVNDHGMFMWDKYLHPIIPVLLDSEVRDEEL